MVRHREEPRAYHESMLLTESCRFKHIAGVVGLDMTQR